MLVGIVPPEATRSSSEIPSDADREQRHVVAAGVDDEQRGRR